MGGCIPAHSRTGRIGQRRRGSGPSGHAFAVNESARQIGERFHFTLGLTEGWRSKKAHTYFAMCPGVNRGEYSPTLHEVHNLSHNEILEQMRDSIAIMRHMNPNLRFIFTVSPVPLIATASGQHVLTATTQSKSILRAVAGALYEEFSIVDYFPSYEIAMNPWLQSVHWESDQRTVTRQLVGNILGHFFEQHPAIQMSSTSQSNKVEEYKPLHCDEMLLDQFSQS